MTSNPYDGINILGGLQRKISDSMNAKLTRPIEDQEIYSALSMNPHKAPGLMVCLLVFSKIIGTL